MRNVWFGVLGRGIYQGRDPGLGVDGWGRRADAGRVRGGGAMQAVRLAGDGPPKAPRQYIKRRRLIAMYER
eukprot:scaffold20526_cov64-Phaeocystis_antarctica.AAC.1